MLWLCHSRVTGGRGGGQQTMIHTTVRMCVCACVIYSMYMYTRLCMLMVDVHVHVPLRLYSYFLIFSTFSDVVWGMK